MFIWPIVYLVVTALGIALLGVTRTFFGVPLTTRNRVGFLLMAGISLACAILIAVVRP